MKPTKLHTLTIRNRIVKTVIVLLGILIIQSCHDQEEYILEAELLQGTWHEVEPEGLGQFAGTTYTFTFQADSFLLEIFSWTDVVYTDENGNPVEPISYGYLKGEYYFDVNTITFNGIKGLNSDFSEPADTSQLSIYNMSYNYKLESLNKLVLNPESKYESITLVKN